MTNDIVEHSNWEVDKSYTPAELTRITQAVIAISNVLLDRKISITVTKHFFEQLQLKRGFGKTTADMLLRTFGKITNRGLHLFKGKELGTNLVFYDKENGLNIAFLKTGENAYTVSTMIRDTRWLGKGTKVEV